MAKSSDLFVLICKTRLNIEVVKEYRFHPVRKWRFDYALPTYKIALEVEGGVWTQGRHTRGSGFLGDIEKYNTATIMGWQVLRVTPKQLKSEGVKLIRDAILNRCNSSTSTSCQNKQEDNNHQD